MNEYIQKVMDNLKKKRFDVMYVEKKEEVLPIIKDMIPENAVVGTGGSVTLDQCGILDLLRSGKYQFMERKAGLSPEETEERIRRGHFSDFFLCSSNAIIEDGSLYNVDGNSNRISAIVHGPKKVIMVVSVKKIVKTLEEAIYRVKAITAPTNCARAGFDVYCAKSGTGKCMAFLNSDAPGMTEGCDSPGRSCCNTLVSNHQRHPGRITIILVGEDVGI